MGFDSGAMAFRCFYLSREMSPEDLGRFADRQLPPIETLTVTQPLRGWAGPAHALDLDFSEEHCVELPYIHLALVTAEKKIPPSTLRAYVRQESDIEMKARGIPFLPRQVKTEIRERVIADLGRDALPSFGSVDCVIDLREGRLFASALAESAVSSLAPAFRETTGCMPVMMLPESAALRRLGIDVNMLEPCLISPNPELAVPSGITLGTDFLTWLYWFWEKGAATFEMDGETCGLMFEGPFLFEAADVPGCHETTLRNGTPQDSPEFGTALWNGKRLRRAKLTLVRGETVVSATVDGADFAFRAVKLPKKHASGPRDESVENLPSALAAPSAPPAPPAERGPVTLTERMDAVGFFVDAFLTLFDTYVRLRTDPAAWAAALGDLRAWVARRAGMDGASAEA